MHSGSPETYCPEEEESSSKSKFNLACEDTTHTSLHIWSVCIRRCVFAKAIINRITNVVRLG